MTEKVKFLIRVSNQLLTLLESFELIDKGSDLNFKIQAFRASRNRLIQSNVDMIALGWKPDSDTAEVLSQYASWLQKSGVVPAVERELMRCFRHILTSTEHKQKCDSNETCNTEKTAETENMLTSYLDRKREWKAISEFSLLFGFSGVGALLLLEKNGIQSPTHLLSLESANCDCYELLSASERIGFMCWRLNWKTKLGVKPQNKLCAIESAPIIDHVWAAGWVNAKEQENYLKQFTEFLANMNGFRFGEVKLIDQDGHDFRNSLKVLVHVLQRPREIDSVRECTQALDQLEKTVGKCNVLGEYGSNHNHRLHLARLQTIGKFQNINNFLQRFLVLDITLCFALQKDTDYKDTFETISGYFSPPVDQLNNALLHFEQAISPSRRKNCDTAYCDAIEYFKLVCEPSKQSESEGSNFGKNISSPGT